MAKRRKPLSEFLIKYYDIIASGSDNTIWKDINIGDVVMYEVSNYGEVRRKGSMVNINPFHSYRKNENGKFILSRPTYLRVQLYYYIGNRRLKKHFEISRLVATAFIPIPKKYIDAGYTAETLQVNHIRGGYEIYNNSVDNLEWCTSEENIHHAHATGLVHAANGESHHSTYLTVKDVDFICKCIREKMNAESTYKEFKKARDSKLSFKKFKPCFYNIKYKRSWRWLSQYYF